MRIVLRMPLAGPTNNFVRRQTKRNPLTCLNLSTHASFFCKGRVRALRVRQAQGRQTHRQNTTPLVDDDDDDMFQTKSEPILTVDPRKEYQEAELFPNVYPPPSSALQSTHAHLRHPFNKLASTTLEAQFKGTSRNRRDRKSTAWETQRTRRTAFDSIRRGTRSRTQYKGAGGSC